MADPKYENLPGIAYDQPDVYETQDGVEEADAKRDRDGDEDAEESVEKIRVDVSDSFRRFNSKKMRTDADFSDELRPKRVDSDMTLAAEGQPETPAERLRRLRCETADLLDLLAREPTAPDSSSEALLSTKRLLDDLNLGDTAEAPDADSLLRKIRISAPHSDTATALLRLRRDEPDAVRLAGLERRLRRLEAAAGSPRDPASRSVDPEPGRSLLSLADRLGSRTAALQPQRLDAAEQRLARLLSLMDSLRDRTSADPEVDGRIRELHESLEKIRGVSHGAILERMRALQALHRRADEFGKSAAELRASQDSLTAGVRNNEALLNAVREAFADNFGAVRKEMERLEARLSEK